MFSSSFLRSYCKFIEVLMIDRFISKTSPHAHSTNKICECLFFLLEKSVQVLCSQTDGHLFFPKSAEDSIHKEVFFTLCGLKSLLKNKKTFRSKFRLSEVRLGEKSGKKKRFSICRWGRRIDGSYIKINI